MDGVTLTPSVRIDDGKPVPVIALLFDEGERIYAFSGDEIQELIKVAQIALGAAEKLSS